MYPMFHIRQESVPAKCDRGDIDAPKSGRNEMKVDVLCWGPHTTVYL